MCCLRAKPVLTQMICKAVNHIVSASSPLDPMNMPDACDAELARAHSEHALALGTRQASNFTTLRSHASVRKDLGWRCTLTCSAAQMGSGTQVFARNRARIHARLPNRCKMGWFEGPRQHGASGPTWLWHGQAGSTPKLCWLCLESPSDLEGATKQGKRLLPKIHVALTSPNTSASVGEGRTSRASESISLRA